MGPAVNQQVNTQRPTIYSADSSQLHVWENFLQTCFFSIKWEMSWLLLFSYAPPQKHTFAFRWLSLQVSAKLSTPHTLGKTIPSDSEVSCQCHMQELTELPTLARVGFPSHRAGYTRRLKRLRRYLLPSFTSAQQILGFMSGHQWKEIRKFKCWNLAKRGFFKALNKSCFSRISNKNSCLKTDDKNSSK